VCPSTVPDAERSGRHDRRPRRSPRKHPEVCPSRPDSTRPPRGMPPAHRRRFARTPPKLHALAWALWRSLARTSLHPIRRKLHANGRTRCCPSTYRTSRLGSRATTWAELPEPGLPQGPAPGAQPPPAWTGRAPQEAQPSVHNRTTGSRPPRRLQTVRLRGASPCDLKPIHSARVSPPP
jgi:hypothetical protein